MARRRREFAPGLPDPKRFGKLEKLPTDELLNYVLQEHLARRAGRHLDLRFGRMGKKGPLYSWAVPSGRMPGVGKKERLLAVRQPLHNGQYASFEGEIVEGYGAGTVRTKDRGSVIVTKATPDQVNFVVAHRKFPERFTLARMKGAGERNWLLINTTPTEIIPHKKLHYTKVEADDVEKLFDPKYLVSEKIDGACLPGAIKVLTDEGWLPIRTIVVRKPDVLVASREADGSLGWRRITAAMKRHKTNERWVSFRCWSYPRKARYVTCTEGHKILTTDGMKHAVKLKAGDRVYVESVVLTPDQHQVYLGGLLGDGCIRKDGSFQFDQSIVHKEFAEWVYSALCGEEEKHACWSESTSPSGYGSRGSVRIKTSRMFKDDRQRFYGNGYKQFSYEDIKDLNELGLAVWFCGDGSAAYRKVDNALMGVTLHTDNFDEATVRLLASFLEVKFGVKADSRRVGKTRKDGGTRFIIYLRQKWARKFLTRIARYVHPSMAYKLRGMPLATQRRVGSALSDIDTSYTAALVPSTVDLIRISDSDKGQYGNNLYVYDLEVEGTHNYIAEGIVVSNSALMKLFHDKLEILSYRPSVKGVPIVHTMRVGGTTDIKIPKHLVGSVLRGEIYGVRKGKTIPPQELGGILNASLAKSIEKQREGNIDLRVALFNILQRGKEPVDIGVAYPKRLEMLREVMQHLPGGKFHLPRMTQRPSQQRKLWHDIIGGLNPRTREGVVAWPIAGGKPVKVKVYPESDVYVREIFPGEKGLEGRAAGGFAYSTTPTGPIVGRVGTGFDTATRIDMFQNPQDWIGRVARIRAQDQFSSGAYRAPAFLALHEDYPAQPMPKTAAYRIGRVLARIS